MFASLTADSATAPVSRREHTVLVVDDEEGFRETALCLRRVEGFSVHTAGNGRDMALLRELPVKLVGGDPRSRSMPILDGTTAVSHAMKADPELAASAGDRHFGSIARAGWRSSSCASRSCSTGCFAAVTMLRRGRRPCDRPGQMFLDRGKLSSRSTS